MANLRDIHNRIDSIKNTKQITNAMKMVAAAKLRKAQERIVGARPYANYIDRMIRTVRKKNRTSEHPLFEESVSTATALLLVVTSDRGLCGSFNSNIIKTAMRYIDSNKNTEILCIGRKGYEYLSRRGYQITDKYINLFNEMDFSCSEEIGQNLINSFLSGKYGKIEVLFNEFKSAIQQDIVVKQLLPIIPIDSDDVSSTDFLYEPDENTVIEELGRKYTDVEIWKVMLESSAAEQGARMTAMDSATDNALELIDSLTLVYNRVRQASITKEIIEISSGAEAIQ
ncbi:MAG: ATP synthase F1 subunit gamma [Candidatus Cloacimonetes bacterium]|nr:ATP synthase F1 subunit gamma [Candidatus Cloacimonadota bacterium]